MSKTTNRTTGIATRIARDVGSLAYTIFKMTTWIVGLGASGFAVLFYSVGAMELIPGALQVAAGAAIVYLIVTKGIKRIFSTPRLLSHTNQDKFSIESGDRRKTHPRFHVTT